MKVGDKIKVEKLIGKIGDILKLNEVLLKTDGDRAEIGAPYIKDAAVEAEILNQARDDKKIIFRYHSKTRYRKTKGHRQNYTELRIAAIR